MNIKIIGSNCKKGFQLYNTAKKVASELKGNIQIQKLGDISLMEEYGIKEKPGLVINNRLVSQGKVLDEREFSNLLAYV